MMGIMTTAKKSMDIVKLLMNSADGELTSGVIYATEFGARVIINDGETKYELTVLSLEPLKNRVIPLTFNKIPVESDNENNI